MRGIGVSRTHGNNWLESYLCVYVMEYDKWKNNNVCHAIGSLRRGASPLSLLLLPLFFLSHRRIPYTSLYTAAMHHLAWHWLSAGERVYATLLINGLCDGGREEEGEREEKPEGSCPLSASAGVRQVRRGCGKNFHTSKSSFHLTLFLASLTRNRLSTL